MQALANNAENVGILAMSLKFNPEFMRVKEVKEGSFMSKDRVKTSFVKSINNTSGVIQVGITREGYRKGASGEGDIFSIIFEPKNIGESTLEVTTSNLWDPDMFKIPADSSAGKISIK